MSNIKIFPIGRSVFSVHIFEQANIQNISHWTLNPLRPTRRWTDAHFCRFLTVLEYSPIGEKFPPTIAPRTLYTVQKKKLENFQNFFCFESFNAPK
jgi:hypothetical protein